MFRSLAAAGVLLAPLHAADFRIGEARLATDGRLELHFPAGPASYYRALRGDVATEIATPVAIGLAGPLRVTVPAQSGFFRVQQISRTAALDTDGDGRDDLAELLAGTDPLARDAAPLGVTQFTSSPAHGEEDIAVTRETVLRFTRPLAEGAVLGQNTFYAEAAGRRLLARTELSRDRRTATLFYLEPLPGAALVSVSLDGDKVRDGQDKPVDADRDGTEGGVGVVRFTTLNHQPVAGTAVSGRVFASELVPGPDTGTNAVNRPLQGVTITVDGQEETLRTVTDAQGNFRLVPAPAGRFFVQVDGRTAAGSQWPDGAYYPFVGKAWEAVPGSATNLAGGNGEIYLPLIQAGALRAVSLTEPTTVTFPAAVLAANPALAGVEVVVPPAALYDDNGARGGRVGLAPVPPDRLPEPLPDGLNFPLVITIQTDGPRNFSQPVPVRFPNLPDPVTGVKLPPLAKTALWSFDHDKGHWEVVGPATVTADGAFVETDPGVGVSQPGWHGVQPGATADGGSLERECESEGRAMLGPITVADLGGGWRQLTVTRGQHPGTVQWFSPESNPQNLAGDSVIMKFCRPGDHAVRAVLAPECYEETIRAVAITIREEEVCELKPLALAGAELSAGTRVTFGPFQHTAGTIEWIAEGGSPAAGVGETFTTVFCEPGTRTLTRKLRTECGRTCEVTDTFEVVDKTVAPNQGCFLEAGIPLEVGSYVVGSPVRLFAPPHVAGTVRWTVLNVFTGEPDGTPSQGEGDEFQVVFSQAGEKRIILSFASDCGDSCEIEILRQVTAAPSPSPAGFEPGPWWSPPPVQPGHVRVRGVEPVARPVEAVPLTAARSAPGRHDSHAPAPARLVSGGAHWFRLENLTSGRVLRGRTASGGVAFPRPLILNAATPHRLTVVTPEGGFGATVEFNSAPMGGRSEVPALLLRRLMGDADADGLPDEAEQVLGSNPNLGDTDGDGVTDGAEARAGTSPLGEDRLPLGAIAGSPTGGHAWDVTLSEDRVLVAAGPAGLAVFNVLNGQRPVLTGRAETPAPALAVAARGDVAALALGTNGLALVNLGTTPNLSARMVPLGGPVNAVAVHDQGVLAGTVRADGKPELVLLNSRGGVIARREFDRPLEDIALAGDIAYVLTARGTDGRLEVVALENPGIRSLEGHDLVTPRGIGNRRLRTVVAGDRVYALHPDGFSFFTRRSNGRLSTPAQRALSDQQGWRHFGVTAGGLLIAAADPVAVGGDHDVQIHRLREAPLPPVVEFQIPTPGSAEAVVIRDGLAYVADGAAGLQTLRFQDADRAGRPPGVTLASSAGGTSAEENERVTVTAQVTDDVAVARVEFLVDGQLVATDEFFPFEHPVVMPLLSGGSTSVKFQARAVDTGGNVGTAPELTLNLTADTSEPWVNETSPGNNEEIEDNAAPVQTLVFWLSEPFNPASFRPELFSVADVGPDGRFGTADDVPIADIVPELLGDEGVLRFHLPRPLPQGRYGFELRQGIVDRKGNLMSYDHQTRFRVVGPWVVAQRPRGFQTWAGSTVRLWFNRPMNRESLAQAVTAVFQRSDLVEDPVPFGLSLEAGGTEAVLRFDPPLEPRPDPGNIFTGQQPLVVRVSRAATDQAGSPLKQEFSTYWMPTVIRNLATETLNLPRVSLNHAPEGFEYRVEIAAPLTLAVSNSGRARVAFERLDGTLVAADAAESFQVTLPAAGSYVLFVTRSPDGSFSTDLTLTPVP